MTKNIHFIANYTDIKTETLSKQKKYFKGDGKWGNLEADPNKPADFWVIQNHHGGYTKWDPHRTLVFQNEPFVTRKAWINIYENMDLFCNYKERNWTGWSLDKTYTELSTGHIFKLNDKKNRLSSIISDLNYLKGHKLRLNFLKYLDKSDKIKVDIYGKQTTEKSVLKTLDNYKGPIEKKDDGLFPYYYHFNAENTQETGYFTEKIIDPILSETLCFYWGSPNISNYIHPMAYVKLDLERPEYSLEIIEKYITMDLYDKHLKYIKYAKDKILNELSIMPLIHKIINDKTK